MPAKLICSDPARGLGSARDLTRGDTDLVRLTRGLLCLTALVHGCSRAPLPLPAATLIETPHIYLLSAPTAVSGEQKHVANGVWSAEDDAFSLPVVPFANGPTEVHDVYLGWGVNATLAMLDSEESAVVISRSTLREGSDPALTFRYVADRALKRDADTDEISASLVRQNGLTQVQEINHFPLYLGRDSVATLHILEGSSYGSRYESCRVDRHFVSETCYFQVTAIAHQPLKPVVPCDFAMELASWTVENLKVGKGCSESCTVSPNGCRP